MVKYLIMGVFITALAGCKKDAVTSLQYERVNLLVRKKWQLKKLELNQPENNPNHQPPHYEEIFPFNDTALNDDYEVYHPDLTYELNGGSSGQKLKGTWHMTDDGGRLFVKYDNFPEGGFWNITSLSTNRLILTQENEVAQQSQINTYEPVD